MTTQIYLPCLVLVYCVGLPRKGSTRWDSQSRDEPIEEKGSTIEEKGKQAYWHEQHKPASEHQCKSILTRETAYLSIYVAIQPRVSTQTKNVICNWDPTIWRLRWLFHWLMFFANPTLNVDIREERWKCGIVKVWDIENTPKCTCLNCILAPRSWPIDDNDDAFVKMSEGSG